MLDDSLYWTSQRRELVQWLEDRAPSFTEGYISAVRLLHTHQFPARVHLICHLIRDIYRYLPSTMGVESSRNPTEGLPDMVKDLFKKWERFPTTGNIPQTRKPSDYLVSAQVHKSLVRLVEKGRKLSSQPNVGNRLAIALFRSLERRNEEFIQPWVIKSFESEYKFFVSKAHLAWSLDSVPTDDGLIEHFVAFERAFHSLVGPYFSGKEELDAILQDTNPNAD